MLLPEPDVRHVRVKAGIFSCGRTGSYLHSHLAEVFICISCCTWSCDAHLGSVDTCNCAHAVSPLCVIYTKHDFC
jgi:hypothetical protein